MFYRKFGLLFQDVVVIGAGGTGGRVIPPLIQEIKQAQAQINPCLYVVDGDIVENNNLSRQNFIEDDLGRNKAVVMAERYGTALDFPVVAHPEFIESNTNLDRVLGESADVQGHRRPIGTRKLVIMCVDSINARLLILNTLRPGDVIIDAGNEDTFGQVSIYDRISVPHSALFQKDFDIKPFSGEYEIPFIPAPINQYLTAMANPPAATGSCANLDQSLAVNFTMASGIIAMVQGLAYNNPFYCRTNYFDIIKGNSSERMTHTWFNQVMSEDISYQNKIVQGWSNLYVSNKFNGNTEYLHDLVDDIGNKVKFIDPALLAIIGQ